MMKNVEELAKLRFNLTEEMNNIMIETILTRQLIDEGKVGNKEYLEKHFEELKRQFIVLFLLNNQKQLEEYKKITNQ